MRIHRPHWRFLRLFVALTQLMGVVGCAGSSAPLGWLPASTETQEDTYGAWIEVRHYRRIADLPSEEVTTTAELIAISATTVFVLGNDSTHAIRSQNITRARLTRYESASHKLAEWTFLGTLSTISHGFFLILTAPIWILGGSIATSKQSSRPNLDYPEHSLDEFRLYARFPQGIPSGLSLLELKRRDEQARPK